MGGETVVGDRGWWRREEEERERGGYWMVVCDVGGVGGVDGWVDCGKRWRVCVYGR